VNCLNTEEARSNIMDKELENVLADIYYSVWEYGQDYEPKDGYGFDDGVSPEQMMFVLSEKKKLIERFEEFYKGLRVIKNTI